MWRVWLGGGAATWPSRSWEGDGDGAHSAGRCGDVACGAQQAGAATLQKQKHKKSTKSVEGKKITHRMLKV